MLFRARRLRVNLADRRASIINYWIEVISMGKYREGQRVYCVSEARYGVLTSDPRLRPSDFPVGMRSTKAIPSYDIRLDNEQRGTYPETDLESVSAHRWGAVNHWVEKHKAILTLVLAVVGVAMTAARLFTPSNSDASSATVHDSKVTDATNPVPPNPLGR